MFVFFNRLLGNEPYFRVECAPKATVRLEGFWCGDRLTTLLFGASNACRTVYPPIRFLKSIHAQCAHIAVSIGAALC